MAPAFSSCITPVDLTDGDDPLEVAVMESIPRSEALTDVEVIEVETFIIDLNLVVITGSSSPRVGKGSAPMPGRTPRLPPARPRLKRRRTGTPVARSEARRTETLASLRRRLRVCQPTYTNDHGCRLVAELQAEGFDEAAATEPATEAELRGGVDAVARALLNPC